MHNNTLQRYTPVACWSDPSGRSVYNFSIPHKVMYLSRQKLDSSTILGKLCIHDRFSFIHNSMKNPSVNCSMWIQAFLEGMEAFKIFFLTIDGGYPWNSIHGHACNAPLSQEIIKLHFLLIISRKPDVCAIDSSLRMRAWILPTSVLDRP